MINLLYMIRYGFRLSMGSQAAPCRRLAVHEQLGVFVNSDILLDVCAFCSASRLPDKWQVLPQVLLNLKYRYRSHTLWLRR